LKRSFRRVVVFLFTCLVGYEETGHLDFGVPGKHAHDPWLGIVSLLHLSHIYTYMYTGTYRSYQSWPRQLSLNIPVVSS
jgi:hypothetical protein